MLLFILNSCILSMHLQFVCYTTYMSKSKCKSMYIVDVIRTPFMPEHEIVLIQTHWKCCYYSEEEEEKWKNVDFWNEIAYARQSAARSFVWFQELLWNEIQLKIKLFSYDITHSYCLFFPRFSINLQIERFRLSSHLFRGLNSNRIYLIIFRKHTSAARRAWIESKK